MWRNLRYVFIVLLFGCSSSKVIYDYDLKSDFSQYKTFLFFADAGKGLNELDLKRFKRSIESELDIYIKSVEKQTGTRIRQCSNFSIIA